MVASQDPPSVPVSLIELSSQTIMHKFNSPAWLKHIQNTPPHRCKNQGPINVYSITSGRHMGGFV